MVRVISIKLLSLFISQNDVSQLSSWPGQPGHSSRYSDWAVGWKFPGSNASRSKRYLSSPEVQTSSGAHPATYSMGTGVFPGGKAVEA
jgi:hypothetical protein